MNSQIERQGEVVHVADGLARIRLERPSACGQCAGRGSCASGNAAEQFVELRVAGAACVGDTVSVSMPAASLVFAALFGYLMPALGLLFGALLGEWGFGGDLAAVLGAALGLLAGLFGARLMARQPLSRHLHPEVSPSGCSHAFQPGDLA